MRDERLKVAGEAGVVCGATLEMRVVDSRAVEVRNMWVVFKLLDDGGEHADALVVR